MLASVHRALDLIPDKVNDLQVSQWAESRRYLPASLTSRPGPFRWATTPYLREIADCLSESSDVREVALMKGARIGYNVGIIENHIGYMIEQCPGAAMFVGANKEQAQTVTELRVDRMLETSGLMGRISSQTTKRANKKTGDSKGKKEFPGGFLLIGGPSGPFLRGTGIRYLYLDELDEWKLQIGARDKKKGVTANQGDPVALARRRTGEYPLTRKIVYGSTPLDDSTSKIKQLFLEGDQCYYYVPCPACGRMQVLKWRDDTREGDDRFRIKYETDAQGRLVFDLAPNGKPIPGTGHVWYECEDPGCRHKWRNSDKLTFLEKGEWRPTAQARTPNFRSFHISSLYSPVGMQSWEDIVLEWLKVGDDLTRLRSFVNTILGETWVESGEAPKHARVEQRALRSGYHVGTLPKDAKPLILTIGADVQKDRIEAEVVAWGRGRESWSVEYLTLPGDTADIDGDAWRALADVLGKEHAGLRSMMNLIDCGYNSPAVYAFCERYSSGVLPVKGDAHLAADRGERRIWALRQETGYQVQRVDLNTGYLKQETYNCLGYGTPDGLPPQNPFPGYCHHPVDYGEDYFRKLISEQKVIDDNGRVRWAPIPGHARNESLDARVYALGALYLVYGLHRQEVQEATTKALGREAQVEYAWADFWRELEDMKKALA